MPLLTYDEYVSSTFSNGFQACGTSGAILSGFIEELLVAAESLIDNYLGRSLCVNVYTDRFRGKGQNCIWTRFSPVVAITGFIYKSVMQSTQFDNYEASFPMCSGNVVGYYLVDDRTGMVESLTPFNNRNRFEIRYLAGYDPIPND